MPVDTTPLFALDAAVLDTETTGLDPARARLIEAAAVRITRGAVERDVLFTSLADPGAPVPPASTAIHHLTEADLRGAPDPVTVIGQLREAVGTRVVIGHAIGFDLAIMKAECERAGQPVWLPARVLDTRLLAQIVMPHLAGFSLEQLASWLGVPLGERHRAEGDARTTANIFLALVPRLREGGIRTFAEAEAACRRLTTVLDEQHRAGWVEPVRAPARIDAERIFARIDPHAYRTRIRDVMSVPPLFVPPETPLREALKFIAERKVSSVYVEMSGQTGILTERDALRAIVADERALERPVSALATAPIVTVPADAYIYRALGRMDRLRIRHLGVTDEDGRLAGALSMRDLLRLRAQSAVNLGDAIDHAEDAAALGQAWATLPAVAQALVREGLSGREVAGVISRELGALTRRAAQLAARDLAAEGDGGPPRPYAVLVLGSAGRGESLLAMDQDNALVYADGPEPDAAVDGWYARLGERLADLLNTVGVPLCKGGVMASSLAFRGSVSTWTARVAEWVRRSRPEDLLNVDIFFDLRAVHGDAAMAASIWNGAFDAARDAPEFIKLLAEAAQAHGSPFTLFGSLREENGRVDLKRAGLFPVVSAARCLAIRHGVRERATPARLRALVAMGIGSEQDLTRMDEAHARVLDIVLRQQLADISAGLPPSSKVRLKDLGSGGQQDLKAALHALDHSARVVQDLMF